MGEINKSLKRNINNNYCIGFIVSIITFVLVVMRYCVSKISKNRKMILGVEYINENERWKNFLFLFNEKKNCIEQQVPHVSTVIVN